MAKIDRYNEISDRMSAISPAPEPSEAQFNRDQLDWILRRALKIPPAKYFGDKMQRQNELMSLYDPPHYRLIQFLQDVEKGNEISAETLRWLAAGARKYLTGERLTYALGLESPKRRGRRTVKQGHSAGVRMFALIHCKNWKYAAAIAKVQAESKVGERTLKTRYSEIRDYAESCGWCKKDG